MRIKLRDGRFLEYCEYGVVAGIPVLLFHGAGSSRVFQPPNDITIQKGVRLITFDRPGHGLSSFHSGRTIVDCADDVRELLEHLEVQSVHIIGHSGGCPYVLAFAYKYPELVKSATIVSGVAPLITRKALSEIQGVNRYGLLLANYLPWSLWRFAVWMLFRDAKRNIRKSFERGANRRPPSDAEIFSDLAVQNNCYESGAEAFAQGTVGHAWETRLICRPWGVPLENIRSSVSIWHGAQDPETPVVMGIWLSKALPNSTFIRVEDGGHLMIFKYWEKILDKIV